MRVVRAGVSSNSWCSCGQALLGGLVINLGGRPIWLSRLTLSSTCKAYQALPCLRNRKCLTRQHNLSRDQDLGSACACAGGGDSTLGEQGGGNSVRRYQACDDNTCEIDEVGRLPQARFNTEGIVG